MKPRGRVGSGRCRTRRSVAPSRSSIIIRSAIGRCLLWPGPSRCRARRSRPGSPSWSESPPCITSRGGGCMSRSIGSRRTAPRSASWPVASATAQRLPSAAPSSGSLAHPRGLSAATGAILTSSAPWKRRPARLDVDRPPEVSAVTPRGRIGDRTPLLCLSNKRYIGCCSSPSFKERCDEWEDPFHGNGTRYRLPGLARFRGYGERGQRRGEGREERQARKLSHRLEGHDAVHVQEGHPWQECLRRRLRDQVTAVPCRESEREIGRA